MAQVSRSLDPVFLERFLERSEEAKRLLAHWQKSDLLAIERGWIHPHWEDRRGRIREYLNGRPDSGFLWQRDIAETMVTGEGGSMYHWARAHLNIGSEAYGSFLARQKEPACGGLYRAPGFNFSSSTMLGCYHVNRLSQVLRLFEEPPEVTVEVGGGFGCFARLMRDALGGRTHVIVDLPELLAVQYLYLSMALGPENLSTNAVEDEKINLVPIGKLEDFQKSADLFVSTFALTETPLAFQRYISSERNYFGAGRIYVTGCREDRFADPVEVERLHGGARHFSKVRDWQDPRLYEVFSWD